VPDRRHEEHVGVLGIDGDLADVLRVVEAQVRPAFPGVVGAIDAVAEAHRVTQRRFAAADVHDVRRGRRHGDRADRGNRLSVEHRLPSPAAVDRLPHAAVHRAEVELFGAARDARGRRHAAAAKRAEHAPAEAGVERRGRLRAERWKQLVGGGAAGARHFEPGDDERGGAGLSGDHEEVATGNVGASRGHAA